jgi:hypothetical protein
VTAVHDFLPSLLPAIATCVAALITGVFSFVNLTLTKGRVLSPAMAVAVPRAVCSNSAYKVQKRSGFMSTAVIFEPPVPSGTYQHFIDFIKDPDSSAPVLSPKRFGQIMHIDLQTLAEQAHVHRNTISRAPDSRGVQDFLRESLRAIKAATDFNGDLNKALFWYRNEPLSAFGYKTAERLVCEGRTDDLLRYMESIAAGAAG